MEAAMLDALRAIVGPTDLLVDPELTVSYGIDWTGRFQGRPGAVVRPADTTQVAAVVTFCAQNDIALVPQGGNTGLVGGGVPLGGEGAAGAGARIAAVPAAAAAVDWSYGVDLASRDSATIGGTIATNAGGLHVVRHGSTRAQLLGIEAVLGTGATVSHMGGLVKDNTGYDLGGLLCGSEGTLGIITAARVRL